MEAKSKRKIIIVIVVSGLAIAVWLGYKVLTFSLFDTEVVELKSIIVPGKEYKLNLYYVPGNATTQSCIQIRQITKTNEYVLKSYERYNYLVSNSIHEGYLRLVLNDTSVINKKPDTVSLKLP